MRCTEPGVWQRPSCGELICAPAAEWPDGEQRDGLLPYRAHLVAQRRVFFPARPSLLM